MRSKKPPKKLVRVWGYYYKYVRNPGPLGLEVFSTRQHARRTRRKDAALGMECGPIFQTMTSVPCWIPKPREKYVSFLGVPFG